jgi:hypothetical protein
LLEWLWFDGDGWCRIRPQPGIVFLAHLCCLGISRNSQALSEATSISSKELMMAGAAGRSSDHSRCQAFGLWESSDQSRQRPGTSVRPFLLQSVARFCSLAAQTFKEQLQVCQPTHDASPAPALNWDLNHRQNGTFRACCSIAGDEELTANGAFTGHRSLQASPPVRAAAAADRNRS